MGEHLVHLLRTPGDGAPHLVTCCGNHGRITLDNSSDQTGQRHVITLEMTVIYSETLALGVIVRIYRQIGASVELYLSLALHRQAAESEVSEGSVRGRKKVIFCIIALHLSCDICLCLVGRRGMEFLEADDVGVLFLEETEHRIGALLAVVYSGLPVMEGETADII